MEETKRPARHGDFLSQSC
ncbi:uncharacterized protein DNG_09653 [Cephalotrichum gorgonifer]|uniref:Uncharacterized protein n=1 Tax=Cephalotrichum gorgonifer TaxID=2041049 RepID=A0AAE8SZI4_9PEZI|nr:uncharacterized protein DNG_09653 [Cephalotrichum gorgonifer]